MDTKQFLRSILDSLQQIDYVKPEDVPNIDLYKIGRASCRERVSSPV